jgi:hypothetical protein
VGGVVLGRSFDGQLYNESLADLSEAHHALNTLPEIQLQRFKVHIHDHNASLVRKIYGPHLECWATHLQFKFIRAEK